MDASATARGVRGQPALLEHPGQLAEALADLGADLDELLFLCRNGKAELAEARLELEAGALHAPTRELLLGQLAATEARYRSSIERLRRLRELTQGGPATPSLVDELAAERTSLADRLRVEQGLMAALVGAADWQSPSFGHSTAPATGRQNGRIRPRWNDYKRDRHLDAEAFERRFVAAMVDGPGDPRALLTSCGMAAFTTVFQFLSMEGRLHGPVIAGAGLYHESRLLLERALPGRVHTVDEADTLALLRTVDRLCPGAVFLDSLSNTKWMPIPELAAVIEHLRGAETYLVIDNTGLSASCQPFAIAGEETRLIVFESLLKYAQLGLDRANAGVIVASCADAASMSFYREHLGTNVADVAVHALPRPDRAVLARRLARLQRNALWLAGRLEGEAGQAVEIVYPGLASHPCARGAHRLAFRGGCLSVVFRDPDPELRREHALVEAAVVEAAARGVAVLAGSSFGFNTTRIYLTADRAEQGEPFVRVAVGTEHRLELARLGAVLASAIRGVAR